MTEVKTKIEQKYVKEGEKAVKNIHLHILQDVFLKAGQILRISPNRLDRIDVINPQPHVSPSFVS